MHKVTEAPKGISLEEQREKTLKFFNDNIPFLKAQLEYENLVADIEEARLKTALLLNKLAELHTTVKDKETQSKNNGNS